jgi:cell wall-associated NlpC family hydrolase
MMLLMPLVAAALANAVVVAPVVDMHARASDDAEVVSQAIFGTSVGILEEANGWARIQTPDGYTGWAPLQPLRRRARLYAASGRVAHVESLFAHIYREPSVIARRPLLTAPFESPLETIGEREDWLNVRLPDGRSAWVQRGDVTFERAPLAIEQLIPLSKRFLGLPYTWGGTSTYGFDCSGFTQMLCRRRGIQIPRDAAPQAAWEGAAPVEKKDLAPGDLLYFGKGSERVTHTGMYIGGGEFIHATARERPVIQISRLDDPHWTEAFLCARRPK